MLIAKPIFQCDSNIFSPAHPSSWKIKNLVQVSKNTTLDGTETRDLTWRKYEYELNWDAMSNTDYDALETLFNYANDNRKTISFTYVKFPQTMTAVEVLGEIKDRTFEAGSGNVLYYSNVTINLIEKSSRV